MRGIADDFEFSASLIECGGHVAWVLVETGDRNEGVKSKRAAEGQGGVGVKGAGRGRRASRGLPWPFVAGQ